jgi:hypothetical protein
MSQQPLSVAQQQQMLANMPAALPLTILQKQHMIASAPQMDEMHRSQARLANMPALPPIQRTNFEKQKGVFVGYNPSSAPLNPSFAQAGPIGFQFSSAHAQGGRRSYRKRSGRSKRKTRRCKNNRRKTHHRKTHRR